MAPERSSTAAASAAAKRKRKHSWRTCSACKRRKQKCELPEAALYSDPSTQPLSEESACRRCLLLGQDCLLDDFDKVGRITQERRRAKRDRDSTNRTAAASTASVVASSTSTSTPAAPTTEVPGQQGDIMQLLAADDTDPSFSLIEPIRTHPEDVTDWKRYSPRSRPITLVSELVMRQMPKRPTRCDFSEHDVCKIVNDESSIRMSRWCATYLLVWLPFLPSPWQVRQEIRNRGDASQASRLLEVCQYLIAMQYSTSFRVASSEQKLRGLLQRYLSHLVLSPPTEWRAALAFELLAAFPLVFTDAEAIEPGLLAGMALRASTVYCATRKEDFLARVQLCSARVWAASYTLGNDDLVRSGYNVGSELPKEKEVLDLLSQLESRESGSKSSSWIGQVVVLLRAYSCAAIEEALKSVKEAEDKTLSEVLRLQHLQAVMERWEGLSAHVKATRYRLLGGLKQAKGLLLWLDMEACEHHLLVSGAVINLAVNVEFTPQYLYNLIVGVGVTPELQKFIFKHGDDRMDAGETLLIHLTNMAEVQETDDYSIFPAVLTCGYLLEAGMLTMDAHGTALKYWHTMPRRSDTSVLALRGGLRLIRSLQETLVVPACVKIVTGMLDAMGIWKRAALQKSSESSSTTTPETLNIADASLFLDELLQDIFGTIEWSDVLGDRGLPTSA